MDWWQIVAGLLLVTYPAVYARQMRVIHRRIAARDGDVEKFKKHMDRPWIRASMWLMPILGIVVVISGVVG